MKRFPNPQPARLAGVDECLARAQARARGPAGVTLPRSTLGLALAVAFTGGFFAGAILFGLVLVNAHTP